MLNAGHRPARALAVGLASALCLWPWPRTDSAEAALSTGPVPSVPRAEANENRSPGGVRRDGALEIALVVTEARWYPEADSGLSEVVQAFAEEGEPPRIPGPLIRVPAGTEIRARVRNALSEDRVTLHGFHPRPGSPDDGLHIDPGASRQVSFVAGEPGTYFYWGTTTGLAFDPEHPRKEDSQLHGALVVDPPGATGPPRDRVFVIGAWSEPADSAGPPPIVPRDVMTINGKSWPYTERIHLTAGDTVRWRWLNPSVDAHPMHLHGFFFRVTSRGTWAADTLYRAGQSRMAVTELMLPGGTMAMEWVPEEPGNWLFHCHFSFHVSHFLSLEKVPDPADPLGPEAPDHTAEGMRGLILGITAEPGGSGERRPEVYGEEARQIRLLVQSASGRYGEHQGLGYLVHEEGPAPSADSVPIMSPPLVLRRGEPVNITVVNRLRAPTGVHWHGMELPSYPDGVPGWSGTPGRLAPPIAPGDSFVAAFTPPRAGTFIYHSHSNEWAQIASGLFGPLIVVDPDEGYDPERERIFVVGGNGPVDSRQGRVNGRLEPDTARLTAGRTYRLRLININPDWRVYLSLKEGDEPLEWRALAKDGADLPPDQALSERARILMGPGETADFAFTPERAGELAFEVTTQLEGWTVRVPIRVSDPSASPMEATAAPDLKPIQWNDNEKAAGVVEDDTLRLDLEVVRGVWRPLGEKGDSVVVLAFAEAGEEPQIPGPMIRVPQGTEVQATVKNTLDTRLQLQGLAGRRDVTQAEGEWLEPRNELPTVEIEPGATRKLRFVADAAGTYLYRGQTFYQDGDRFIFGSPTAAEPWEGDPLAGAFIVDSPGERPAENEKVIVIQEFVGDTTPGGEPEGQQFFTINGRPWPHTERLAYDMGDVITWRVINASFSPHPMHLHGFFYEVLSRGDIARDTIYWSAQRRKAVTERMEPRTTMKVRWSPDRPGGWIFHCHISMHVSPNPPLAGELPTGRERFLRLLRVDDPTDPHHHAEHGMGGLVMGLYIRPPEGWTPEEPVGEPIRLHVREDSVPGHALPRFGYALGEPGELPPTGEVPFPGPPLVLHEGPPAAVRVVNETDEPTTTHWHGLELESLYDGVAGGTGYPERPTPAIMPGDSFDVALRTDRPGTYIYHTHMADIRQQGAGLYGPLIILPEGEEWHPETDRVFIVGNGRGEIEPPQRPLPLLFLNGSREPEPQEMVVGTEYRLRLINITTGAAGLIFRLVRDGFPVEWEPLAHDGWELPIYQRGAVQARQNVDVGETYDFAFTPERPGELHLEARFSGGPVLVDQPIRLVEPGEER